MITKRIIPCLDVDNGRVVKGTNFVDIKDAGDPVELAKKYAESGADELVFLDITASSNKRHILKDLVQQVAKEIFIPFTVGGGINSIEMMQDILDLGADKLSLNTAALHNPTLVQTASQHFGSQCVVIAVDIKQRTGPPAPLFSDNPQLAHLASDTTTTREVFSHGGRKNLGIDALKWITTCADMGAGEILLTSMDRDGTQNGYDTEFLALARSQVSIPMIASGGAGTIDHIREALDVCDAALLASLLHYGTLRIEDIKSTLSHQGVRIR
ncbi:MAG: imidazole glycerol phosphate synthase subunit HisF [Candidatus Marinamargulisbacteria bacterium]